MSDVISILLVDDQHIVRKGIALLLANQQEVEIIGQAKNGVEAVEAALLLNPDVILMDLIMPEMDGVEATRQIMGANPDAHILVLTSNETLDQIQQVMQIGALGYSLKDSTLPELMAAIQKVHRGDISLHPAIARKVLFRYSATDREAQDILDSLATRELEVLVLLGHGLSNAQIAAEMQLTNATVRNYVSSILSKLGVKNRVQAMLIALNKGIVSLEEIDTLNPTV